MSAGGFSLAIEKQESVPTLAPGWVHVWRVVAEDDDLLEYTAVLSREENARAAQFHFERDRRLFTKCRAALRRLAGFYTGDEARSIRFNFGALGKPSLAGRGARDVRFNISHSRDVGLLAFALDFDLGVDLEFMRDDIDFAGLAKIVFSESERRALVPCPPAVRANLFYEYWTCKEACIKADGRGLSIPLEQLTVDRREKGSPWREIVVNSPGVIASDLRSRVLKVANGYAAAIATTAPRFKIRLMDYPSGQRLRALATPERNRDCGSPLAPNCCEGV